MSGIAPAAFLLAAKVKAHELRGKNKAELQSQLKDLKGELSALRVAKVGTRAAPSSWAQGWQDAVKSFRPPF